MLEVECERRKCRHESCKYTESISWTRCQLTSVLIEVVSFYTEHLYSKNYYAVFSRRIHRLAYRPLHRRSKEYSHFFTDGANGLKVEVKVGDALKEGQVVAISEAMKIGVSA